MPAIPRRIREQNLFALDRNARRWLGRRAGAALAAHDALLHDFGAWVGDAVDRAAAYTDRHGRPRLESYDADGALTNRIVHNPAWEAVEREVYRRGVIGLNYEDPPAPFLITFAMGYWLSQADVSLHCPVTMTGAVAYVLDRFAPAGVRERYLPELVRRDGKALTGGTWATEQHGGSDVGASTTLARRDGNAVTLRGLKWFTSNANGGLALATARPEGAPAGNQGLGLYLVPTHLEDGEANPMRIRRLKDKLGTTGVPTGEIDLTDTWAVPVCEPPDGLRLMMEALLFSRIHNAVASAGLHRRAALEALAFAAHREAFGRAITDYPMVQDELIDLFVGQEASLGLAFEAAAAFDAARDGDPRDPMDEPRTWLRLATALAKYFTAEQANTAARAAIELIGGNGYIYDFVTPRLLRDAQVLTVWEGPANIQALELLRMLAPDRPGLRLFALRVQQAIGQAPAPLAGLGAVLGAAWEQCRSRLAYMTESPARQQRHARRLLALLAEILAAALLLEEASAAWAAGDARKALVLRLFLARRLAPSADHGIGPDTEWTSQWFWPLVSDGAIETADAAAALKGDNLA